MPDVNPDIKPTPMVPANADGIPDTLKVRPQWICWDYEQVNQRWTKVPKTPGCGTHASATDPGTWTEFESAEADIANNLHDGLGFVFASDDGVIGVDLDRAIDPDTKQLKPWAQKIVDRLDSYTEVSPSGTGVHIICLGHHDALEAHGINREYEDGRGEMYAQGKYFCTTGAHWPGTPPTLEDRSEAIAEVYGWISSWKKPKASTRQAEGREDHYRNGKPAAPPRNPRGGLVGRPCNYLPPDVISSVEEMLDRIKHDYGGRFERLFDGDTSLFGGDHSSSDMALIERLLWWSSGDRWLADRVFRCSKLMRPKWDELRGDQTYGQLTIDKQFDQMRGDRGFRQPRKPATDQAGPDQQTDRIGFTWRPIPSTTFATTDFQPAWLVNRVIVKAQPCIMGGPKKCLKTSVLLDLAISLATATPFLGKFTVPRSVKVCVFSGESGPFALQQTGERICAAKGMDLTTCGDNLLWHFDLPQLAHDGDMKELTEGLKGEGIEVAIVDPLYLCLLSGQDADTNPASIFAMGPLLLEVARAILGAGATPILCHHSRKGLPIGNPLDLDDLSFAGAAEFARQWLLVSRRTAFDPEQGLSELWLSIGGSVGHSSTWGVDITEGVLDDDFGGRGWDVKVRPATEVIKDNNDEKTHEKVAKKIEQQILDDRAYLAAVDALVSEGAAMGEDGLPAASFTQVRDRCGVSKERSRAAFLRLLDNGSLQQIRATVASGNGTRKECNGLRRAPKDEAFF